MAWLEIGRRRNHVGSAQLLIELLLVVRRVKRGEHLFNVVDKAEHPDRIAVVVVGVVEQLLLRRHANHLAAAIVPVGRSKSRLAFVLRVAAARRLGSFSPSRLVVLLHCDKSLLLLLLLVSRCVPLRASRALVAFGLVDCANHYCCSVVNL